MLQRLTIENFIRLAFLDVKPNHPVVLFAGQNEVGKSSIAEAVRFVMRGESPRIQYKSERQQLLTNGASKGAVTLAWDNVTVKRNIKDGKATGDTQYLPSDDVVTDICLQAQSFARMDDKARRSFIMQLAEIDLSVDRIAAKLLEKGAEPAQVKKYRPLLAGGIKDAHAHAKRSLSDARGAWKEVTGEVYGRQKAVDWKPEAAVIDDIEELAKSVAEIDADLAGLKADSAADTARLRDSFDSKVAPVSAKMAEYEQQLKKPEPLACPHCGEPVLIVSGKVEKFTDADIHRERIKTLLSGAAIKRQGLRDELNRELEKVANKSSAKVEELTANRSALQEQLSLVERADAKTRRASELHDDIVGLERMESLLSDGPDGVAASLIAEALRPLNERLLEIAHDLGWQPAVIHGDMSIGRGDGHVYVLLSESAQWRIDAMLHTLISELAEFPWLVFDRMDVLDVGSRNQFIRWSAAYAKERSDEATILIMATLKQKPNLSKVDGIDVCWLE